MRKSTQEMLAETVWNSSAIYSSFPDYDCRWAGPIAGSYHGETWSQLREELIAGGVSFAPQTLALAHQALDDEPTVCPLGRLTACWALHTAGVHACRRTTEELPLLAAIASRWPLLRFLAHVRRTSWVRPVGGIFSCESMFHPSIDWDSWHATVEAVETEDFEEDKMETLGGDAVDKAGEEAGGIVWKYSSDAEYEGTTISSFTKLCLHGVKAAFVLRASGLVMGDLDVFKMVEAALGIVGGDNRIEDLLNSRWPLLALLHRFSCMKRRWDDLAFAPTDLLLNSVSPVATRVAQLLSMGYPGPVLVAFVSAARAKYLPDFTLHAERLGIWRRTLVLPQNADILQDCSSLMDACLPVLSVFPELSKYTLLAFAAKLGVSVLFADLDMYWAQNPFPLLPRHDDLDAADVYVATEFYSNQTRPSVMLVQANARSHRTFANLAIWLLRFPFLGADSGIRHLLEPDRPGYVPSVSFLRPDDPPEHGKLQLGVFDSENQFVTWDGWYGSVDSVVALELGSAYPDQSKLQLLDALYKSTGDQQAQASRLLLTVQRPMTPKRPMEIMQDTVDGPRQLALEPDVRIVHVNFADGCCETEQAKSSRTALEFGANESRPLRGDFLTADFRERNAHLLKWVRGHDLTSGKTPSGKVGYYVWKPFVVLETLKDPSIEWNDIVLWTDAGVHFIRELRPLVERYLASSDISATQTPMMEGDVTKRDAFILLDADHDSIVRTSQIATGIILVRKTPLAMRFMENWLSACEDERIITETPSALGVPDYPNFRHHNDDQSAFSLLFKKYGFHPFLQAERDLYVVAARNTAKFVAASDAFALGKSCSQDEYLSAANAAAEST